MASPLASFFDKRRMAIARARFKAWWEGAEFDEEAAQHAIAQAANAPEEPPLDLFEPEPPRLDARLNALTKLWGPGRIAPGDGEAERGYAALLSLKPEGKAAMIGPGLSQPVVEFAAGHQGAISVFEWREETYTACAGQLTVAKLGDRVNCQRIDLEAHLWEQAQFDGLISLDEFTFADEPTRLAHHVARALKPDALCVIEAYAGFASPDIAPAFATSFAEPQIRAAGDLAHYLIESGLKIESQDDLTEQHLSRAREGFKRLEATLADSGGLDVQTARELAWEAEAWRTRLKLLARRQIERRRVIARRPG